MPVAHHEGELSVTQFYDRLTVDSWDVVMDHDAPDGSTGAAPLFAAETQSHQPIASCEVLRPNAGRWSLKRLRTLLYEKTEQASRRHFPGCDHCSHLDRRHPLRAFRHVWVEAFDL